ncbi:MAG TPA: 1,4-dihydroxy-2-naphthoate polyprenyltransferase [Anaerolineaceae bacterium]|nr:1,4-dihydroxy-2-naphthoate polyprenyltransferase [Anaerolineaceae bacterium]
MITEKDSLSNMSYIHRWWLGIRPRTLPAAIAPVLVGWGIVIGTNSSSFKIFPALVILFCSVLIQIGTNLVNDVVDFEKGIDTQERQGPTRVTQSGLLTPSQVRAGVAITFGLAAAAGIYLFSIAGWPVLIIGAASILAGISYSTGPFPLAHNGLGDLFVLIFFGFVAVCGTVFVLYGSIPLIAWLSGLAIGGLTVNILVVNNIRDIETDRKSGRRTIPVVFGRLTAEIEYGIFFAIAFLMPEFLLLFHLSQIWILITLVSLQYGFGVVRTMLSAKEGPMYNKALAKTGQLLLYYSILYAIGLAANAFYSSFSPQ